MHARNIGRRGQDNRWTDRWPQATVFTETIVERHMEKLWSYLTINWGRIEFQLHAILLSVNGKRALEWTIEFFQPPTAMPSKAQKLRKRFEQFAASQPAWAELLEKILADIEELCRRRNPLAHGIWYRVADGKFNVQPLSLYQGGLKEVVSIEIGDLVSLVKLMDDIIAKCAWLGSEALAYEWLRDYEKKRAVARELERGPESTSV